MEYRRGRIYVEYRRYPEKGAAAAAGAFWRGLRPGPARDHRLALAIIGVAALLILTKMKSCPSRS
jgi:hypothetical protein